MKSKVRKISLLLVTCILLSLLSELLLKIPLLYDFTVIPYSIISISILVPFMFSARLGIIYYFLIYALLNPIISSMSFSSYAFLYLNLLIKNLYILFTGILLRRILANRNLSISSVMFWCFILLMSFDMTFVLLFSPNEIYSFLSYTIFEKIYYYGLTTVLMPFFLKLCYRIYIL